jgi:hypothetical protein
VSSACNGGWRYIFDFRWGERTREPDSAQQSEAVAARQ